MKSHVLSLFAVTALFATTVNAQTIHRPLRADVPFGFQAGKEKLPAGEYDLLSIAPGVLQVRNVESRRSIVLSAHAADRGAARGPAKFVFHRYGGNYFLRQVWTDGPSGMEVAASQLERELQAKAPAETAIVAARKR